MPLTQQDYERLGSDSVIFSIAFAYRLAIKLVLMIFTYTKVDLNSKAGTNTGAEA